MLTNLAYGGGGDNTYNDTKTITSNPVESYTTPYYMIPPNSNKTISPQEPSTSTDGGVTNPQYGYLYNWCAAMGGQTNACNNTSTSGHDTNISICPAGWRLPTGGYATGELYALNLAVNNGDIYSPAGILSTWLGMFSGQWMANRFTSQGSRGFYLSSTKDNVAYAFAFDFNNSSTNQNILNTSRDFAIRCIAL